MERQKDLETSYEHKCEKQWALDLFIENSNKIKELTTQNNLLLEMSDDKGFDLQEEFNKIEGAKMLVEYLAKCKTNGTEPDQGYIRYLKGEELDPRI